MSSGVQLSIVMPVYNEAEGVADIVAELMREIADQLENVELIAVNDASTDDSGQILDGLAASDPRVKVHHAARNRGHGPSLRCALDASAGEWIFQIDSDGQQVACEFWKLWERRDFADLVMGMRRIHRNGRHRVVVSAAVRYINRLLGGGNIRDVNVPFKLFHRDVWEDLAEDMPREPMVPSLLLAVGAGVRGWRISQVGIACLARRHGESTVDVPKLIRLSWSALKELLAYRARLARRPARSMQVPPPAWARASAARIQSPATNPAPTPGPR